jgi:phospholipid/cholesterol/gamma-HCH transport system substrate-binding protein
MKIKKEYKAALIAIVSLILFIWGFNYLKGKDILKSYNTFFAVTDNVEGLVKSTPVTLKGIQIGTLEDLKFYNGIDKTMIVLNIDKNFVFAKDSKVKIYGGNIMGGKSVAIVPGTSPEMAQDGDTLSIMKMPGMFDLVNDKLTPLQDKFERILTSTDTLLLSINHILNPSTQNNIKNTLADLEITVRNFKNSTAQFDAMMRKNQSHLDNSFENVDKLTSGFAQLSDSIKQINIGEMVNRLNKTINKLNAGLDKLNKGDGTMAKLMNDKKLYENLERSTKELELLLKDLREHPKRYVHFSLWGRKEKK